MSSTDMSRQGIQKKPSFLRRLTKGSESAPPPLPPTGPPQLPRLSTLFNDNTTLVASVSKPAGPNGDAAAPYLGGAGNNFMSGTKYGDSHSQHPISPPSHSLPPGAAAPATMSPNGSTWRNSNNQGSGFRVQNRPTSYDAAGAPVTAPHARPNGTPIATMHRQQQNGMPNGIANGGPRPMPNGTADGSYHIMSSESMPNGVAKALPSSPPQAPPKQFANGAANGGFAYSAKALPTSPPMAPPKQLPNSPPMAPPRQLPNGAASPRPLPTAVPNGHALPMPNSIAMPQPQVNGGYVSPPPTMARSGQHQLPPLPPGAATAHRSPPMATLASPPMSPTEHFTPADPKGGFAQQVYSRPPMLDASGGNARQSHRPPRTTSIDATQSRGQPTSPPQFSDGPRNVQSPPLSGPTFANQQRNVQAPPMHHQQQPPQMHSSTPPPNAQSPPQFAARGHRPAPAPPLEMPNGAAPSMIAPPTRSTSASQGRFAPSPMSPPTGTRALPAVPNGPAHTASGATVHVIASSDHRRMSASTPAVAPPPSSSTPVNVAAPNNPSSRPKISIPPTHSTSPPPQPQPYTAPVLAAATAATSTPQAPRAPAHEQQRGQASDLLSPIEFPSSPPTAKPSPSIQAPTPYGGVGNGIPPPSASSLAGGQHPPRTRSSTAQARRIASSPLASPAVSTPSSPTRTTHTPASSGSRSVSASSALTGPPRFPRRPDSPARSSQSSPRSSTTARAASVMDRPRPQLRSKSDKTLTYLLTHPRVTMSLLPFLNINSFLNLLGSDDDLRKYISGEMVGRWVMREWGITVERERGRSWPGLTVWEGFLESLLHDPAVYSTYPGQYHNLLRHLSLSHSLIVLFLRTLPSNAFPYAPPLPFDDDLQLPPLHKSSSVGSFHSMGGRRFGSRPGSRAGSYAGSDAGGSGGKMPRRERVTEVVMPEPLSAGPRDSAPALPVNGGLGPNHRRGSIGSIASAAPSFGFGRKRSNSASSVQSAAFAAAPSAAQPAAPVAQGKAAFPPVSYPTAKRYEFRRYGDQSSLSPSGNGGLSWSRPGSIMSVQSSSMTHGNAMSSSRSIDTLAAPPPIGGGNRRGPRSSLTSSSSRRSDIGGSNSPVQRRWDSPTQSARVELAFERPPPYMTGRAPILRVFVPVSDKVPRWPSAEGAAISWRELEKCGASKRMRLGDLVVNTALSRPSNTEHVLIFVPFVQHKLVPLEYVHCSTGHLPHYLDAFALSPTYYDPFLPTPQIIYLDFAPWAQQAMNSVRLAYERRDHTTSSGARISAKRYLHVGGIEIQAGDRAAPEWQGMISLEAEGTAEGRLAMEARFGHGDPSRCVMGPWEVVRERSMLGSLWLRLIPEEQR